MAYFIDEKRAALARALFDLPSHSPTRILMEERARAVLGRDPAPTDVTHELADEVAPDDAGEEGARPALRAPGDVEAEIRGLANAAEQEPQELAVYEGGRCVASLVLARDGHDCIQPAEPTSAYPVRYCVTPDGADIDAGYDAPGLTVTLSGAEGATRVAEGTDAAAAAGALLSALVAGREARSRGWTLATMARIGGAGEAERAVSAILAAAAAGRP